MSSPRVILIFKDSYLAVIKNSLKAKMWRNLYARVDGQKKDIVKDGELSCAFFVSSVLVIFGLAKKVHATVNGTIKDLEKSGWYLIKSPKVGCVLIWEATKNSNGHRHTGFYISKDKAVSIDFETGEPSLHDLAFNNKRKIEAIYWHKLLK